MVTYHVSIPCRREELTLHNEDLNKLINIKKEKQKEDMKDRIKDELTLQNEGLKNINMG